MKLSPLLLGLICLVGCKPAVYILYKTSYITKEAKVQRELLNIKKSDTYKVAVMIECPRDQKILYKTQNTLICKDENGDWAGEGSKSNDHITSFNATKDVKTGTTWAYKTEFKTPIKDGRFIVKVGDSVVLAKVLTGKNVKIDYGFKLP